jgi:POT family proton-dependent oligopeptide transporter
MPTATGRAPGHPPGLYVLFFTEMWERYSFYSMMSILVLYMDEKLRFSHGTQGQIYGGYLAGVYFMPLFGGFIADRWWGYSRTIIVGGLLITLGHFALAFETLPLFYAALVLLACGTGLLKPNVSSMVGNLYTHRPDLKDAAYNIFYMGINIGGFLGPVCVSYLRAHYGWSVALGSAGIAMLISLAIFVLLKHHVASAGERVALRAPSERPPDPPDVGARIVALLVVFAIVIAFWLAFYQNGFALTFWARDNTATTVPPEVFYSVNSLCIILFTLPLVQFWSYLNARGQEPRTTTKILIGMLLTIVSFGIMLVAAWAGGDTGRVSPAWLVSSYAFIALAEICLSPMGMSLVAKLAPPRLQGVMMGAWFITQAVGGYFSGYIGAYWHTLPHSTFFIIVLGLTVLATVALAIAVQWLRPTFDRALAEEKELQKIPA